MKTMRIIVILVLLVLVIPVSVLATKEQKGIHEPGTDSENQELKQQALEVERQKEIDEPGTGLEQQGQGVKLESPEMEDVEDVVVTDLDEEAEVKETGKQKSKTKGIYEPGAGSERSADRRSQVANSVQEILMVAERNAGVGQQIRTIAQVQNQIQEQVEEAIQEVQKRSKLVKFFIGPNYGRLKQVEENLGVNAEQLKELKELKGQVENIKDIAVLEQEISIMEQVGADLELEVKNEKKGFSLFGWLNRLFSK